MHFADARTELGTELGKGSSLSKAIEYKTRRRATVLELRDDRCFNLRILSGMALMRISLLGPNSNGTLAFGYVGLTVGILSVTVALLLLICTVADLVKKEKRSPLHWFGILAFWFSQLCQRSQLCSR